VITAKSPRKRISLSEGFAVGLSGNLFSYGPLQMVSEAPLSTIYNYLIFKTSRKNLSSLKRKIGEMSIFFLAFKTILSTKNKNSKGCSWKS
jgi:hypothetical protein